MRKKGCYHKNRPFGLLVAAALRFVQSYLKVVQMITAIGLNSNGHSIAPFRRTRANGHGAVLCFAGGGHGIAGRAAAATGRICSYGTILYHACWCV